jgi:hypothetical protein
MLRRQRSRRQRGVTSTPLPTISARKNPMIFLGSFTQQAAPPVAPALGCLFPLDADLSGAGATPFPISDTTTDPQVFGFELIRDSSSPDYTAAAAGTLAMFMGDTSSPFFDASEWTSEIVILGAIRHDNIAAIGGGRADFALVFGNAGFAQTCQIALAVDGGVDNHYVVVRGVGAEGAEQALVQSGIADGSNVTTGIYLNTATRQIGAFYNTTDLGYLQYSPGLGGDPEDLLAPEGDLFVYATGSDSSSENSHARTVLFGATFSKSQVTGFTGVPAGSVDTCGNPATEIAEPPVEPPAFNPESLIGDFGAFFDFRTNDGLFSDLAKTTASVNAGGVVVMERNGIELVRAGNVPKWEDGLGIFTDGSTGPVEFRSAGLSDRSFPTAGVFVYSCGGWRTGGHGTVSTMATSARMLNGTTVTAIRADIGKSRSYGLSSTGTYIPLKVLDTALADSAIGFCMTGVKDGTRYFASTDMPYATSGYTGATINVNNIGISMAGGSNPSITRGILITDRLLTADDLNNLNTYLGVTRT